MSEMRRGSGNAHENRAPGQWLQAAGHRSRWFSQGEGQSDRLPIHKGSKIKGAFALSKSSRQNGTIRPSESHSGAHRNNAKIPPCLSRSRALLSQFENDPSLLEPDSLSQRLDILDQLDLHFPQAGLAPDPNLESRAQSLRVRLEAANLAPLRIHPQRNP